MPMKKPSAGQGLSRAKARNCVLINQCAAPGLGSLMAGRYLAGAGQFLLALVGFGFVVAWFVAVMWQLYQQFESGGPVKSVAWMAEVGWSAFALSWLWAGVTSLSLLSEARADEVAPPRRI